MAQNNHHRSPHLSHLHQGSAPNPPAMATPGSSARPAYPSPTNTYPSPSQIQNHNQLNSYNQSATMTGEYRASPTSSSGGSLPVMHNFAHHPHPHPQQHLAAQVAQVAPMANNASYYPNPSQYANTSDPNGGPARYALPVAIDSRGMKAGQHKKEIKRRTKTGCLTCRKRRIKCDEAHPECRNCQKSKRECLGYDPIFKQQPGPTNIQPAPASGISAPNANNNQNPYGQQPLMQQASYGAVNNMAFDAGLGATGNSPAAATNQYEYAPAIDPALEGSATFPAGNSTLQGTPMYHHFSVSPKAVPRFVQKAHASLHLRGGGSIFAKSDLQNNVTYTNLFLAKYSVQELLDLVGPAPQAHTDITQIPSKIEEMKQLYFSLYAPALDSFLETKYYTAHGLNKLLSDRSLMELSERLLFQFANTNAASEKDMIIAANVESRVVWALAGMVKQSASDNIKAEYKTVPLADDAVEAAHRLAVFENLLTGQVAKGNALTRPPQTNTADGHKIREMEFWYHLANFVCLREGDPASIRDMNETTKKLRTLLDGRENRDILYSIVIIRALTSQKVTEYPKDQAPLQLDEDDPRSKLHVAKEFIYNESHGAGTTNVIRRLCELFHRQMSTAPPATATAQNLK